MTEPSWTVAEPSLPALTYTYSFGPGMANALALVADGNVALVSAPCNPPDSAFAEIEKHGKVRALIAPNAYHHMGIGPWKARFPEAEVFAPVQSIPRVEKHSGVTGIRPVAEATKLLGDRVELIDMPHYKTGEVLVRWPIEGGCAWFVTDVMFNMPTLPKGPFGWLMKWTKSGPGLRRNAIANALMVKDKRALYAWLAEQAEKAPPRMVVACHIVTERLSDPQAGIRAALA
jgi:hypothetical protein